MLTIENVRAALSFSDPAQELDRLIKAQLAVGQTTGALYAQLVPIVRSIRSGGELSEDVDEILLGTLDALIGHCNPNECYADPATSPISNGSLASSKASRLVREI